MLRILIKTLMSRAFFIGESIFTLAVRYIFVLMTVGIYSVMNHCVGCIFVLMTVGIYSIMNRCVGCIFILMNVGIYSIMNRCVGWIFVLMTGHYSIHESLCGLYFHF